jgi:hypothetical protein
MARYEIAAPDGARYEVTAPDAMPEAAVLERFRAELGAAQPQPPEMGWGEYAKGLGRQALQGLTFNFGDELGLVDRAKTEEFGRQYPIASTVAGIGGSLPLFAAGPGAWAARAAMGGRSLLGNVGRSAAFGAGAGALAGAGAGEGDVMDRLPSAATGAAFGGVLGGAIPPVVAGVGAAAGPAARLFQRARPRTPTEPPPVQPVGTPEPVAFGVPLSGATFVDDRTMPALNAQEGALQMISDWVTRSGGTADDIAGAWNALQEAQRRFHGTGRVINAQTLAELHPPLQRLLRSAASGFTEAGEDVTRFLSARQTGVLPRGADARALAERGIPTRERFLPEQTGAEAERTLGTRFGVPVENAVPTGQLSRLVDMTKRMFQIKDYRHHGHASNASRTSDDILAAMRAESDPAYTKAFAAGDMVPLRPTLQAVLQKWEQTAAASATAIRRVLERGINQFRAGDKQFVNRLRDFDSGKQALDDLIGDHLGKNSGRLLQQMKRELLDAVDGIQQGGVGALYKTARGIYARGARDREILEEWSTAIKDDPDAVAARYDALASDEEKKLAELGITWGLQRTAAGRRAAQDATLPFDTNNAMAVLAAIGRRQRAGRGDAEEVMRAFGRLVEGEQEMIRGTAKTAIGGSMTDRNLQDALSMGVMEIAQNVQSWSNIWRGSQSMFDMGQRIFTAIIDRAFGMSADRARELSRMLLTANPAEITAIIARLRMIQPANRMARFSQLLGEAQRAFAPGIATGAGAVGAPTPQPAAPAGPTML